MQGRYGRVARWRRVVDPPYGPSGVSYGGCGHPAELHERAGRCHLDYLWMGPCQCHTFRQGVPRNGPMAFLERVIVDRGLRRQCRAVRGSSIGALPARNAVPRPWMPVHPATGVRDMCTTSTEVLDPQREGLLLHPHAAVLVAPANRAVGPRRAPHVQRQVITDARARRQEVQRLVRLLASHAWSEPVTGWISTDTASAWPSPTLSTTSLTSCAHGCRSPARRVPAAPPPAPTGQPPLRARPARRSAPAQSERALATRAAQVSQRWRSRTPGRSRAPASCTPSAPRTARGLCLRRHRSRREAEADRLALRQQALDLLRRAARAIGRGRPIGVGRRRSACRCHPRSAIDDSLRVPAGLRRRVRLPAHRQQHRARGLGVVGVPAVDHVGDRSRSSATSDG